MFKPWQLAVIDDAGYNGIRDEHIDRVAQSLLATGLAEIDHNTFEKRLHICILISSSCFKTPIYN